MAEIILRKEINNELVADLACKCGLNDLLIKLLVNRGIDTEVKVNKFLYGSLSDMSDFNSYKGMKEAVDRIKKAIQNGERILVYGDYDCDGIGAIAILFLTFRDNGIPIDYYIPTRADEGYGLNCNALLKIKKDFNPNLIITVDCGITSIEEVAFCKSLEMDIVVTDHHRGNDLTPDCIIVDPFFNPELTQLCGAGVACKLACGLFGEKYAYKYLDICAVSTIADLVPLTRDNRLIAKYGLELIEKGRCRIGIKALLDISKTEAKTLNTYDVSFKIAPRLNASGRLASAYSSLSLLIEDDVTAVNMIAEELELQNKQRQIMNGEIYAQALEALRDYDFGKYKIIMLYNPGWNDGVIGIVSAKLVEHFHLPAILFTDNDKGIKGSARSVDGVNIYDAIASAGEYLTRFGGHSMAAGVSMEKANFNSFLNKVNDYIVNNCPIVYEARKITVDLSFPVKNFNEEILKTLQLLEPYGQCNPQPVFVNKNSDYVFKQIGVSPHIKARTKSGDFIAFNRYSQLSLFNGEGNKHLIYTITKNQFNGRIFTQFKFLDGVFDIQKPDKYVICEGYLRTFAPLKRELISSPPKIIRSNHPILYVAFTYTSFCKIMENNPKLNKVMFYQKSFDCMDTVVLSPTENFEYCYYNTVIVLDYVCEKFKRYLSAINNNTVFRDEKNEKLTNITISRLREIYVFLYNSVDQNYKFCDAVSLYNNVSVLFNGNCEEFLEAFYIFADVGLLTVNDNGILIINKTKVDIEDSVLYKYLSK